MGDVDGVAAGEEGGGGGKEEVFSRLTEYVHI